MQKIIRTTWGKAFRIKVSGESPFANKNRKSTFPVKFVIHDTYFNPHWTVIVRKIVPGFSLTSSANWESRTFKLDTEDVKVSSTALGGLQIGVAHEFGHAIGNVFQVSYGDEYVQNTEYYEDRNSIMNAGMVIRKRHLEFIMAELNKMIPDTFFYL